VRTLFQDVADKWYQPWNGIKRPDDFTPGSTVECGWIRSFPCGHSSKCMMSVQQFIRSESEYHREQITNPKTRICPEGCGSLAKTHPHLIGKIYFDLPEDQRLVKARELALTLTAGSHEKIPLFHISDTCKTLHLRTPFVYNVTKENATDCPMCSVPCQKLCPCGCNNLAKTHPHLIGKIYFDLPEDQRLGKARELALTLTAGSHEKIPLFHISDTCKTLHLWMTAVYHMTQENATDCPMCSMPCQKLCPCGCNSMNQTHKHLVKEWDDKANGDLKPDMVRAGTKKLIGWIHVTKKGVVHRWKASGGNRSRAINPSGCPHCQFSRGEVTVEIALLAAGIPFIPQFKIYPNARPCALKVDFYLPSMNRFIEFDGPQHLQAVTFFGGEAKLTYQRGLDKEKDGHCSQNGRMLLRVHHKDMAEIPETIRKFCKLPADFIHKIVYSMSYPVDDVSAKL